MYKVRSVKISGQGSVILNKMIGHMFISFIVILEVNI